MLKFGTFTKKQTLMIDSNSKDWLTSSSQRNLTQRKESSSSIELLSLKHLNQKASEIFTT